MLQAQQAQASTAQSREVGNFMGMCPLSLLAQLP
jgi:hypothetical protein